MAEESDVAPTVDVRTGSWIEESRSRWEDRWRDRHARGGAEASATSGGVSAPVGSGAWLHSHGIADRFTGRPRVLVLQSGDGASAHEAIRSGIEVVGIDFSRVATAAARDRLSEVRASHPSDAAERSRFVLANVYAARHLFPEPDSFDVVLTSGRALGSLPVLEPWAQLVEWFLAPGAVCVVEDVVAGDAAVGGTVDYRHTADAVVEALAAAGLVAGVNAGRHGGTVNGSGVHRAMVFQRRAEHTA
ncbi:MAG: class I SAM-dependent methyltransferase [Mycetocola sp.]